MIDSGGGIMMQRPLMTEYGHHNGDIFVLHCIILLHAVVLVVTSEWHANLHRDTILELVICIYVMNT